MQVIPNESHDGKEAGDGADEEAPVDQSEVLHVLVLLQEHLRDKRAAQPLCNVPRCSGEGGTPGAQGD